jgi:PTS system cellobiose-specific IIB component
MLFVWQHRQFSRQKDTVTGGKKGHPLIVSAVGLENFASVAPAFDGFLVAPHIQYKVAEIRGIVGDARSIAVIESLPYASLDAEKVFAFVMAQMPELAI